MSDNADPFKTALPKSPHVPAILPDMLFKYTTLDSARSILAKNTVRWSSPLKFNDPLDAQWDPFWNVRGEQQKWRNVRVLSVLLSGSDPLPPPEQTRALDLPRMRAELREIDPRDRDSYLRQRLRSSDMLLMNAELRYERSKLDELRRMRVFCLSRTYSSVLMWSHYADNHRGVVLGFNRHVLARAWGEPLSVEYVEQLPELINADAWTRLYLTGGESPEPQTDQLAKLKAKDWHYEQESRYFKQLDPGGKGDESFECLPEGAVCAVFAGLRSDFAKTREVALLANGLNSAVSFSQAAVKRGHFQMETESWDPRFDRCTS